MAPPFSIEDYDQAAHQILHQTSSRPRVGMVLGSGISDLANQVDQPLTIPYTDIPHFPASTVPGHAGRLVIGTLAGVDVCIMQGRFHYYEGYSLQQVTFPMRCMARMGIKTLILTNAAGGLNPAYELGDIMLIEDHINLAGMAGHSPLRGPNLDEFGPRFPAANRVYTRRLRQLASDIALEREIHLQRGAYAFVAGPNFETAAEVRFLRLIGADAVGMSTVPEALVAHHAGLQVLAFSTITNMTIDQLDSEAEPTHEEVMEAGKVIVPRLTQMLLGVLGGIS